MKNINILSAVILSVFLLSICYGQEDENKSTGSMRKSSASSQMVQEINDVESQIIDAVKSKDMDKFGNFLSDDFKGVYANGIYTKEEEISRAKNSQLNSMQKSDENVVFQAENVALLTYKADRNYVVNGKDMSGTYNVSSVLVKENGQWKVIEHTMIKEEK
jgi:ketosteroid isomerase-like protein